MSKWNLNEDSTGTLTLEFSGDVWAEALDKAYEKNKDSVKVDGFREGNVPKNVFIKKFGYDSLYSDAIDYLLENNYSNALLENKIEPVSYPEVAIENVDENGVIIKLTVAVAPELKLGDYKGLEVEVTTTTVTDELVDAEVSKLLDQHAEMIVKDGAVEDGDTAVIDYEGFKGDVAFEGGKAENHPLVIGSGSFIPGFEEQVKGMKVGEEKAINLTFPAEYHSEDLAGAEVVFNVKLNEIKTRQVPELSDEFVSELELEANNVSELKAMIKDNLTKNFDAQKENTINEMLLDKAAQNSEVEIPKQMIDTEVTRMINDTANQFAQQGISMEQYFQITGTSEEDLRNQVRDDASKRVRHMLTLEKLIEELKIEVKEEEVNEELSKMAEMYSMEVEALEQAIGGRGQVEFSVKARKVFTSLKDSAVIKEVENA